MRKNKSYAAVPVLMILLLAAVAAFLIGRPFYRQTVLPKPQTNATQSIDAIKPFPSGMPEAAQRTLIDDCTDPSLWREGTDAADEAVSMTVTSEGEEAALQRKFDGFLTLGHYLWLDMEAKDAQNIAWAVLYLSEDAAFSNCFQADLMPFLTGGGQVVLNRIDFSFMAGSPRWDAVSTIRIAVCAKEGTTAALTLSRIETYDANALCSIWFDDGLRSTYLNAFPVMRGKGFSGIVSVISSHVGYPDYCSEEELRALYDAGWDMANHTASHTDLTKVDEAAAENEIRTCREYLLSHGLSRGANHFVPPYSAVNDPVLRIVADQCVSSRSVWDGYNRLPVTDPYKLAYFEAEGGMPAEEIFQRIDEACDNGLWLIILFHSVSTPAQAATCYDTEQFDKIVEYLDAKRAQIKTVTLSDLCGTMEISPLAGGTAVQTGTAAGWEEDFSGVTLSQKDWNVVSRPPSANNELQTYAKENVQVKDGMLTITSVKTPQGGYVSGAVTTENKRLFQNGKIEIRAKLPIGQGLFPAIWLMPQSGDAFPEIDILEFRGHEKDVAWHVLHTSKSAGRYYCEVKMKNIGGAFHTFGLTRDGTHVSWTIDGKETYGITEYIPNVKMYLIINTAVGGDWVGSPDKTTPFPSVMVVDYVKFYE